jgi:hypothetical protein
MERARHSWREACALALKESDPKKLFGRIEYALTTLERRYAECEFAPLTPAERKAIRKMILALEQRLQEKLAAYPAVDPRVKKLSSMPEDVIVRELAHARHLLYILRP